MNNFLLFKREEIEPTIYQVEDSLRIEHLHKVLKSSEGDEIKVCLINHGLGMARLEKLEKNSARLCLIEQFPGQIAPYHLLMGLSRPPTCKKVLEHGTSLGVSSFHFFKAELSEKSYLDSKLFSEEKYHELLNLGLSQSSIYFQTPTFELSKYFPSNFEKYPQKYLLSLEAGKKFNELKPNFDEPILLAVGPERGWTESEEAFFLKQGFTPIKISPSTLRVEIATFAALGQLEALRP